MRLPITSRRRFRSWSSSNLGLIPLLTDIFRVNMSITIMAGLGFASILTLIVIPVLYSILFRITYTRST